MKLDDFLKERGINYEKHLHTSTFTAQGLAQVEHVSGYMVAKPVIVKGERGFAMCVVAAPKHVDLELVSRALHEPHVRLATETEMAELFPGVELGAEPPIGSLFGMKTVMDVGLHHDEYLVMQAGSHRQAIKIRREDWEKVCQPLAANITQD